MRPRAALRAVPGLVLAGLAPGLSSDPESGACVEWQVVWYTYAMSEHYYVENQLLSGLLLRAPSLHRPLRAIAEAALRSGDHAAAAAAVDGVAPQPRFPTTPWRGRPDDMDAALLQAAMDVGAGIRDCTVAVTRLRQTPKCEASAHLAEACRSRGLRCAFVVLGEEERGCKACPAFFEAAQLVIRHYHHDDCSPLSSRVLTLPMGLGNAPPEGVQRGGLPAVQRRFAWSFASGHRTEVRGRVSSLFKKHFAGLSGEEKYEFSLIYPGKDPEYMHTMCNSKFALCPRGNVEDTWRIHEALFCGAIPVVTDGGRYFSRYMPESLTRLFVTLSVDVSQDSFRAAVREIKALLRSPQELESRQRLLLQEHASYEGGWRQDLLERVGSVGAARPAASRQASGEL